MTLPIKENINVIDNIPTSRLIGRRATARYVDDRGRRYCAIHHRRSEFAIVARTSKKVSENGMTFLGTIVRWSGGPGHHEWGCYWTALGGMERGPYRGVRAALCAFVQHMRSGLISAPEAQ